MSKILVSYIFTGDRDSAIKMENSELAMSMEAIFTEDSELGIKMEFIFTENSEHAMSMEAWRLVFITMVSHCTAQYK